MKRLDDSWQRWLKENLDRGCDPRELAGILLKHEFSPDAIRDSMGAKLPADFLAPQTRSGSGVDYRALSRPPLLRNSSGLELARVETDRLQLYVLERFMAPEECEALCVRINSALRPSTITLADLDTQFRTSRTCDLSLLQDAFADSIDERICRTLGIRPPYSEGNQGQRYDLGQQFKAHTDFFEPGTAEYAEHAAGRGNRTWTFMVYLNEGMQGGGTYFPALDATFEPRVGRALIWNNLTPDGAPNYDTLHSGTPVTAGHKIIITKWFRERGSGAMFYE